MNIFQIFGVIMGSLVIILCAIFARTKKIGCNNLFEMLMISIGAVTLTIITVLYPSWWMVGIMTYGLFGVWLYCSLNYNDVKGYLSREFKSNKTRTKLRNSSEWICMIVLVAISVLMLLKCWAWYVGVVFIPIGAFSAFISLARLRQVLKDIW